MTSSVYRPVLCSVSPLVIPEIRGVEQIACANGSKISGDSGHFYWVPLLIGKGSERSLDDHNLALEEE